MDPAALAATAIAAALPYLVTVVKEGAKGAAGAAGKSVWDWVRAKLTSEAGKEVVKDLECGPEDSDNRKAAEATLSKLLKSDLSLQSELARLLEKPDATSTTITANVVGNENILGQASDSASVAIYTTGAPRTH
jgi:hypothetical protein